MDPSYYRSLEYTYNFMQRLYVMPVMLFSL